MGDHYLVCLCFYFIWLILGEQQVRLRVVGPNGTWVGDPEFILFLLLIYNICSTQGRQEVRDRILSRVLSI